VSERQKNELEILCMITAVASRHSLECICSLGSTFVPVSGRPVVRSLVDWLAMLLPVSHVHLSLFAVPSESAEPKVPRR